MTIDAEKGECFRPLSSPGAVKQILWLSTQNSAFMPLKVLDAQAYNVNIATGKYKFPRLPKPTKQQTNPIMK